MATIRFGAECDRCHVAHNNYDVGDIRECEDCQRDLCGLCAAATRHVVGRADDERYGTWVETEAQPVADAIADAETFMRVLGICYPASKNAYAQAYAAQWAAQFALRSGAPYLYGAQAAHHAFLAVPGLRA